MNLGDVGNKAGGYRTGRPLPIIPRSRPHDSSRRHPVTRMATQSETASNPDLAIGPERKAQHRTTSVHGKHELANHGGGLSSSH